MSIILFFSLTEIFLTKHLFAQNYHFEFTSLSTVNGLSSNNVSCILRDSEGFMWFGTDNGLNKYDGYTFTVYKNNPDDTNSISHSKILSILEDHDHNIWIGTERGGFDRYDRKHNKFIRYFPPGNSTDNSGSDIVPVIYEDQQKQLWIGTYSGLYIFNRTTHSFTGFFHQKNNKSLSNSSIFSILEDHKQKLWIGTADGLNCYNPQKKEFNRYFFNRGKTEQENFNFIRSIYIDEHNILWLGTYNGGLIRFNPDSNTFKRYLPNKSGKNCISHNRILCVTGDHHGTLYIGTENGGLNILNCKTGKFSHFYNELGNNSGISSNSIYSVYRDKNGILWLGTYNGGIDLTSKQSQGFRHYEAKEGSLDNPYVLCICEDKKGKLWIGTDGGGVNVLNRKTGKYTYYKHDDKNLNSLSANEVTALLPGKNGKMWIGTYLGGLDLLDPSTGKFTHFRHDPNDSTTLQHNFVQTIYKDSKGELLIGLLSGIDIYNKKNHTFSRFKYPKIDTGVLSIMEDHNKNLWLGTLEGVSYISRNGDTVINYVSDPSHNKSDIPGMTHAICEDSKGNMWFGTNKGLYLFNKSKRLFTRYRINNKLSNIYIAGIDEDHRGNLWISSGSGLVKIEDARDVPAKPNVMLYDEDDFPKGLYHSKEGEIFFSGHSGFYSFYPENIIPNTTIPPIVLTDFKIFNKEVPIGEKGSPLKESITESTKIILSHNESVITFQFAALNFIRPDKNQYAYKMEGFETNWNYVGNNRSATYTNLDPGNYTFRVKGSNNEGVWNDTGTYLKIKIVPPWWKTIWAYICYIIISLLGLYGGWRFLLNRERMKQQLIIQQIHAEKLEEINQMKTRFFSNITHEFRTPLTLIISPLKQLMKEEHGEALRAKYRMILRNSERLNHLINQLLNLSKLESSHLPLKAGKTDLTDFLLDIIADFDLLAKQKNINLTFANQLDGSPQNNNEIFIDRDKLEKIISNLLSNAFKFTPEKGQINVTLKKYIQESQSNDHQKIHHPYKGFRHFFSQSFLKISPTYLRSDNKPMTDQISEFVEISISDSGIGFPKEYIDKIFDRFYQVDDSITRGYEGSGIGLSLTKELVELHHGTISVASDVNQGTSFTIRLPMGKAHLSENELSENTDEDLISSRIKPEEIFSEQNDTETASYSSEKSSSQVRSLVLIIEDNQDLRNFLCDFFQKNYSVLSAADGIQGIETAFDRIPDLIICDVMMPLLDGFTLCDKIKSDERTSHIPIILLTSKASPDSKVKGLNNGADDYITKPFEMEELAIRAKNLIKLRKRLINKYVHTNSINIEEFNINTADKRFLERAKTILEDNMENGDFNVEIFAQNMSLSRVQLYRKIHGLTGLSVSDFIRHFRLIKAKELLEQRYDTVSQVAYKVGFNNLSYFSKSFYKQFGVLPSNYLNPKI